MATQTIGTVPGQISVGSSVTTTTDSIVNTVLNNRNTSVLSGSSSVGAGASPRYRMRATDGTLGQLVYWTATIVDSAGSQYTGPGPLTNIIVAKIVQ